MSTRSALRSPRHSHACLHSRNIIFVSPRTYQRTPSCLFLAWCVLSSQVFHGLPIPNPPIVHVASPSGRSQLSNTRTAVSIVTQGYRPFQLHKTRSALGKARPPDQECYVQAKQVTEQQSISLIAVKSCVLTRWKRCYERVYSADFGRLFQPAYGETAVQQPGISHPFLFLGI